MESNYKKLLCALSVITLVVIIIQLNDAFGSNLEQNYNTIVENKANLDENNLEINNKQNLTSSININKNDQVTVGSDIKVFEGQPISLKLLIANAISFPAKSLIYSWNQLEGPKINLAEEAKKVKFSFYSSKQSY